MSAEENGSRQELKEVGVKVGNSFRNEESNSLVMSLGRSVEEVHSSRVM